MRSWPVVPSMTLGSNKTKVGAGSWGFESDHPTTRVVLLPNVCYDKSLRVE